MADEQHDLAERIAEFLARLERGGNSEEEVSQMMRELEQLSPHAELSGIIFYGERDRTPAEMAAEALTRERLWIEGGEATVKARVIMLMRAALADPQTPESHRYSAMQILSDLG